MKKKIINWIKILVVKTFKVRDLLEKYVNLIDPLIIGLVKIYESK